MKHMRAAAAGVALLVWVSSGHAQTSAWVDPAGRFTVAFAANGYTPLPHDGDVTTLIDVEHAPQQQASGRARVCSVTQARVPNAPALTQEQLNIAIRARSEDEVRESIMGELSDYARMTVDGVAVASFRLDTGNVRQYWRLFYLAHEGGVYQTSLSCGGTMPLEGPELSTIGQTLNSLHFTTEAAQ